MVKKLIKKTNNYKIYKNILNLGKHKFSNYIVTFKYNNRELTRKFNTLKEAQKYAKELDKRIKIALKILNK